MNTKKIYLAGAITGLPEDQVLAKFRIKTAALQQEGYEVYNPVDQIWSAGLKSLSWSDIMKACIQIMLNCDAICLLPCWQSRRGAQLERDIALRLGMNIIYS